MKDSTFVLILSLLLLTACGALGAFWKQDIICAEAVKNTVFLPACESYFEKYSPAYRSE